MKKLVFNLILAGVLSGCGAAGEEEANVDVEDNTLQQSTRISSTTIAPGVNGCDNGGVLISSGFDENENRILDSDEVSATQVICHGLNGTSGTSGTDGLTSLIRMYDELAGDNCANGGIKIVSGVDSDSNTWLSSSEIQDTRYLCASDTAANEAGRSCTVADNNDGSATISCDDGTSAIITSGEDGSNGSAGVDGNSCTVVDNNDGTATVSCADGSSVSIGNQNGSLDYIVQCSGQLDDGFSEVYWEYEGYVYDNEDVMIRAGISDAEIEVNRIMIYSSMDPNYEETPITIWFDRFGTSNYGYWDLSFDSINFGVNVSYFDIDVTDGQKTWVSDPNDCHLVDYTTP